MKARPIISRSQKYDYFTHESMGFTILYRFPRGQMGGGKYLSLNLNHGTLFPNTIWRICCNRDNYSGWIPLTIEKAKEHFPSAFL